MNNWVKTNITDIIKCKFMKSFVQVFNESYQDAQMKKCDNTVMLSYEIYGCQRCKLWTKRYCE